MTRRLLLLVPMAACFAADSEKEVEQLISSAVTGLSAGKPELFLEVFDPAMPDLEKLRTAVNGLVSQAEVSCSLEVWTNQGDDSERTLTIDWILNAVRKDGNSGSVHRQKMVKCQVRKNGRKWRVVAFEPFALFAPM